MTDLSNSAVMGAPPCAGERLTARFANLFCLPRSANKLACANGCSMGNQSHHDHSTHPE